MSNENYIRGDGNGGLEGQLQKRLLKKWGPIGALLFMMFGGLASQVGGQVWEMVLDRPAELQRLDQVERQLETYKADAAVVDADLKQELRAVRANLDEIRVLLIQMKEGQ